MTGQPSTVNRDESMRNNLSDLRDDGRSADVSLAGTSAARPAVGQQLRIGRERCGMSVDDVARALKLSSRQVESLEESEWERLPGKTMIRGFVRNYARLVGLDGQALMSELEVSALPGSPELRGTVGTPVSMPAEGTSDRRDVVRVLAGVIVLALAMLVYFFVTPESWQSAVQAFKAASQPSQTAVDVEPSPAEVEAPVAEVKTENPPAEVSTETPASEPTSVAEPVPATPAPVAEAPVTNVLKFSFAQPSWVEVRDRTGQVVYSRMNPGGTQRDVEGQPPFSVVVGNATHVTLQYKGATVDLSKRSRDDVARVTVE